MWWGSRPRQCLKIGPDEIVWAEMGRAWTGRRHDRCLVRSVDPGVIRLSPAEPNLVNPAAVQNLVRSLVGPARRLRVVGQAMTPPVPVPIVLLLPDVCVRTAVFELERVPRKREERDALVRWRFGQDHLFPLAGARIGYQVLPPIGDKEAAKRTTVMAMALHEEVLTQYEALCDACNLVPVEVTTPTVQLCNLWLEKHVLPGRPGAASDALWVSLMDRTFTVLAFHRGRLSFTRSKLLAGVQSVDSGKPLNGDQLDWVAREVDASVRIWQEATPEAAIGKILLATDEPETDLSRLLHEQLGADVEHIDWTLFRQLGWTKRMQQLPLSAMPAVAGLC